MQLRDFYLLSPEISLAGLAFLVILFDLVTDKKGWVAALSVVGLLVPMGFAISLLGQHDTAFGGFLIVDKFAIFFKFLFMSVAALVIMASQDYVSKFKNFQGEYYALVLLASGGMMLMAASGELITIYLSLELNALSLAALVAFLQDKKSTEGSFKFLILSAISSAVMLYGMALVFGLTGSTKLADIATKIPPGRLLETPALLIGVVFIVAGFGFKISSFPFQMWVPDVYEGAPTPITAYLSVASKAAGFAVLLRVFYLAFNVVAIDWSMLFAVLSALSMSWGNFIAISQTNIKRMLGYSTIAHAGYLLVGLAAVTVRMPDGQPLGPQGVLFYLGAYAFTNLGAFIAITAITNKINSDNIEDFAGMGRRAPLLAGVLTFCLISLTGLPPTAIFWGKIYLFNAAVQSDLVWLAIIGVINSVVSAYYYLRVVKVMYLQPPKSEEKVPSSGALDFALVTAGAGVLFFGVLPQLLLDFVVSSIKTFPG